MVDLTGHKKEEITLNEKGGAEFPCNGGSVSVWVTKELAQNFLGS
jgi:alpha-amylase